MSYPFDRLTDSQSYNVEEFMSDNQHLLEIKGKSPRELTSWEVVSAWLQWNGIIGYTDEIISLVKRAYDCK